MIDMRRIMDMGPHFEDLKALHRAHWDESGEEGTFNFQYDWFRSLWNQQVIRTYGLFHDDRLVGHATAYVMPDIRTGELNAEDQALYVLPEYRTGFGAALWRFGEQQLKAEGIGELGATVSVKNRVSRMALHKGYKIVSSRYVKRLNARKDHGKAISTATA